MVRARMHSEVKRTVQKEGQIPLDEVQLAFDLLQSVGVVDCGVLLQLGCYLVSAWPESSVEA